MDVGDVKQDLRDELVTLRKSEGVTPPRLAKRPTLMQHLGSESACENVARLVALVGKIQDVKQRDAVKNAFLDDSHEKRSLLQRRKHLAAQWHCSTSTVRNCEDEGLVNLVDLILQASPRQENSVLGESSLSTDVTRDLKRTGYLLKEFAYAFWGSARAQGGASNDELQRYAEGMVDAREKRRELREQVD